MFTTKDLEVLTVQDYNTERMQSCFIHHGYLVELSHQDGIYEYFIYGIYAGIQTNIFAEQCEDIGSCYTRSVTAIGDNFMWRNK